MKKLRKHILIVCALLLFGIAFLTLTANAESTVFPWLSPGGNSMTDAEQDTDSESNTSSEIKDKTASFHAGEAGTIFIAPIGGLTDINSTETPETDTVSDNKYNDVPGRMEIDEGTLEPTATAALVSAVKVSENNTSSETSSEAPEPPSSSSGSSGGSTSSEDSSSGSSSGSANSSSPENTSDDSNSGGTTHHHHDHDSINITGVALDENDLTLLKGGSAVLTATISPSNATQDKTIVWSSSDKSIAMVNNSGKVTAVKGGKVTITATTANGKTATCMVTVSVPATGISLSLSDVPVERGSTLALIATLDPPESTDKILWATSNSVIATVDSSGTVTGVSPGTAVITASVGDGTISASCQVTTVVSVSKLDLSETELSLKKGEEHTLTARVLPEDTTEDKAVTWSSSDDSVATVDSSGKVTAVKGGTAIITAQTGSHSAQCAVTITVPVTGITFSQNSYTLARGTAEALSPVITPEDATDKGITWGSLDQAIATVDSSGNVTAVGAGTTAITAITHDGRYVAQCTITVVVPVTGITLDQTELSLKKGSTDFLTAVIAPEDATDKSIVWSSSNDSVATVDSSGKVTAVEGGTAIITAQTGSHSAQCAVTVTVPVIGITFSQDSYTLARGTAEALSPVIAPEDATDKSITWDSLDQAIATVDSSGNVTAVGAGTTAITAITHDGGYVAQCTITVVVPVTGITLDQMELSLKKGSTDFLTAVIAPEDATDKSIVWSSSDDSVATVDSSGKVRAISGGTATITATTQDGGFTTSCDVTVTVPVTGISLNTSSLTLMPGNSSTLTATFTPPDATNKNVTWTSSNPSVISVDQNGQVRAEASGTATVTVTSQDGGYTAQCSVTTAVTWTYTVSTDDTFKNHLSDIEFGPSVSDSASTFAEIKKTGGQIEEGVTYTFSKPVNINKISIEYGGGFLGGNSYAQGRVNIYKHDGQGLQDVSEKYYDDLSPITYSNLGLVDQIYVYTYFRGGNDHPRGGSDVVVTINDAFRLNNSGTSAGQ